MGSNDKTTILFLFSEELTKHENRVCPNVLRGVLDEYKATVARLMTALASSIFSLLSLPLFIVSFSLGFRSLETSPLRYLLLTLHMITIVSHLLTFVLYGDCRRKEEISYYIGIVDFHHELEESRLYLRMLSK